MKYTVVLDSKKSYLLPSESGYSYKEAVKLILDYVKEAAYSTQETLWEIALDSQEDNK